MAKVKRGPLNKAELYYVEGNRDSLTPEQIAEDLTRSKTTIENYLKKNPKVEGTSVGDQFARQSGATVMTENASSMSDAHKANFEKPQKDCIARIK
tara:strand:- start:72 stop:359 length:288 start_codon:yes stop_codon:yes gene_type:complete